MFWNLCTPMNMTQGEDQFQGSHLNEHVGPNLAAPTLMQSRPQNGNGLLIKPGQVQCFAEGVGCIGGCRGPLPGTAGSETNFGLAVLKRMAEVEARIDVAGDGSTLARRSPDEVAPEWAATQGEQADEDEDEDEEDEAEEDDEEDDESQDGANASPTVPEAAPAESDELGGLKPLIRLGCSRPAEAHKAPMSARGPAPSAKGDGDCDAGMQESSDEEVQPPPTPPTSTEEGSARWQPLSTDGTQEDKTQPRRPLVLQERESPTVFRSEARVDDEETRALQKEAALKLSSDAREAREMRERVRAFLHEHGYQHVLAKTTQRTLTKTYPLHRAVASNNAEMVTLLLRLRADPAQRNSWGQTPTDLAVQREHKLGGHSAVLKALVESPQAARANAAGRSAGGKSPASRTRSAGRGAGGSVGGKSPAARSGTS